MFRKEQKSTHKPGDIIGFIGKGMTMEGKLHFEDTVRIEGSFKGEIDATGTLVIGESGYVEGKIKVASAIITGEVKGSLDASTRVEITSPGKLYGDIKTPNLIIGDGAVFEGNCIMVKKHAPASHEIDYGEEKKAEGL